MKAQICRTAGADEPQSFDSTESQSVARAKSWNAIYDAEGNRLPTPRATNISYELTRLPSRWTPFPEPRLSDHFSDRDAQSIYRSNTIAKKEAVISNIIRYFNDWLDSRLMVLNFQYGDSSCLAGCNQPYRSNGPDVADKSNQYPETYHIAIEACTERPTPTGSVVSGRSYLLDREISRLSIHSSNAAPNFEDFTFGASTVRNREEDVQNVLDVVLPPVKRNRLSNKTTNNFACPFLQHNREVYASQRSCASSGWPTVHRVKEHIYRKHRLAQYQCNRCRQVFESMDQLSDHQRIEEPCKIRFEEMQDGINEAQLQSIRSRKKPRSQSGTLVELSEEEKWLKMYTVIFPKDNPVPSPYHDSTHDVPSDYPTPDEESRNLLKELADYARRELPKLMRPGLANMLEGISDDSSVTKQITDIAQSAFQQILENFTPTNTDSQTPQVSTMQSANYSDLGRPTSSPVNAGNSPDPSTSSTQTEPTHSSSNLSVPSSEQEVTKVNTMFQDIVVDSLQDCNFLFDGFLGSSTHLHDSPVHNYGQDTDYDSSDCQGSERSKFPASQFLCFSGLSICYFGGGWNTRDGLQKQIGGFSTDSDMVDVEIEFKALCAKLRQLYKGKSEVIATTGRLQIENNDLPMEIIDLRKPAKQIRKTIARNEIKNLERGLTVDRTDLPEGQPKSNASFPSTAYTITVTTLTTTTTMTKATTVMTISLVF
ncbi:hypothetical protein VTL71DRAFT_926 [Oculimacula yallundae]|uniref:C2H2-type domain-containing protein n=1 Tax=Oculimacula yallundae TaxID=86028 RepID=A0ABR4D2W2_9HELO